MPETVDIYVDGSFKDGKYAWAFVVYDNGGEIHNDCGLGKNADAVTMRNVAGELAAAMRAVNWAVKQGIGKVVIYHDYSGISEWVIGSWKAKKELVKKYAAFMRPHYQTGFIKFQKVSGHSGIAGNERADKLAASAFIGAA